MAPHRGEPRSRAGKKLCRAAQRRCPSQPIAMKLHGSLSVLDTPGDTGWHAPASGIGICTDGEPGRLVTQAGPVCTSPTKTLAPKVPSSHYEGANPAAMPAPPLWRRLAISLALSVILRTAPVFGSEGGDPGAARSSLRGPDRRGRRGLRSPTVRKPPASAPHHLRRHGDRRRRYWADTAATASARVKADFVRGFVEWMLINVINLVEKHSEFDIEVGKPAVFQRRHPGRDRRDGGQRPCDEGRSAPCVRARPAFASST